MYENKKEQNRIEWVDTAKGIGLLLVIFGHLHVPYLATWIYFFHMPLFFFLSGVVYTGGQKYSFAEFLKKRIRSLIIPYFTFGVIIWSFYAIVNCFIEPEQSLYGTNMDMLKGLLVQEHFWTIWFLTALFLTEMLYYIMDGITKQNGKALTVISAATCIFGLVRYRLGFGALPWNLDIALVAQFFFHAGRVFRGSRLMQVVELGNKKKSTAYMAGFLLINVFCGGLGIKIARESLDMSVGLYGNELLTFASALAGIFFVIFLASLLPLTCFRYLGKNTMVIFALHSRIVIVLCRYIYDALGIFQGDGFAERLTCAGITFFIIMLVLIPATELIKRRRTHALFGM